MKKALLSFAAIAMLFASCQKDDLNNGPDTPVVEGVPTYATLKLVGDASGLKSKATLPDDGGSNDANSISDAVILIFDSEGSQLLTNKVEVTSAAATTISLKSGQKRIFTLCNVAGKEEIQKMIETLSVGSTTLPLYYAKMSNPYVSTNADGMGLEWPDITATNNLFMSNGASVNSKFTVKPDITEEGSTTPGGDNYFSIVVKRGVAKASLKLANENTNVTKKEGVTLGNMQFGMRNINRSMFYSQQFQSDNTNDNDYNAENAPAAPTRSYGAYYYTPMTAVEFDKYYYDHTFDVALTTTQSRATYINENSNDNQVVGNSTYWGISSRIDEIPANQIVATFERLSSPTSPLKPRTYKITAATTPFTRADGATDDIYVMRTTPPRDFVILEGDQRIFLAADKAFEALYNQLEVLGAIGTPSNNDNALNGKNTPADTSDDIWAGNIPATHQLGGDYYFADAASLKTEFTSGDGQTAGNPYTGTKFMKISEDLKARIGMSLSDMFGFYKGGNNYHRLNIKENNGSGTFHAVRRNYSYSGTITGINAIGEPTEGDLDKDPETPVDEKLTHITANITVQSWRNTTVDGDI